MRRGQLSVQHRHASARYPITRVHHIAAKNGAVDAGRTHNPVNALRNDAPADEHDQAKAEQQRRV